LSSTSASGPLDHPHADEWFRRDVTNIARFFKRLRLTRLPPAWSKSCEADMLFARIPAERLGVLIGPDGETKRRLQELTGTRIAVDSASGEVTIDERGANDPVMASRHATSYRR